ncbi:MAG: hypothetical protein K2Q28_14585 [Hyphomicrobium sp.]|nr:hypothetical protein [Hyphomicrobium sp.]
MRKTNLSQYLTLRNIFLAIVALNILSAMTTSRLSGKFHEAAKPMVRTVPSTANAPAAGPPLIAHIVPGEAVDLTAGPPVESRRPDTAKPSAQAKPRRQKSNPPGVNWLMLVAMGAMALYARYLAARMAQNAVVHAVDSIKQIAGALRAFGAGGRAPAKPAHAAPPPSTQALHKMQAAKPRKSTVVRASRWPFAA